MHVHYEKLLKFKLKEESKTYVIYPLDIIIINILKYIPPDYFNAYIIFMQFKNGMIEYTIVILKNLIILNILMNHQL